MAGASRQLHANLLRGRVSIRRSKSLTKVCAVAIHTHWQKIHPYSVSCSLADAHLPPGFAPDSRRHSLPSIPSIPTPPPLPHRQHPLLGPNHSSYYMPLVPPRVPLHFPGGMTPSDAIRRPAPLCAAGARLRRVESAMLTAAGLGEGLGSPSTTAGFLTLFRFILSRPLEALLLIRSTRE